MSNHTDISGCRVLLAEDEPFIALMLEDYFTECGCLIIGVTNNIDKCLNVASKEKIDFAILDVRLGSDEVFPAAEILEKRNVPFLLLSGLGLEAAPADKPHWMAVAKPFTFEILATALGDLLRPAKTLESVH